MTVKYIWVMRMLLYHGSKYIVEQPQYGKGKRNNDYGIGFYCTASMELAKEWACDDTYDGYANIYEIDEANLNILRLNNAEYNILHWLTLLLKYRTFRITNDLAKDAKDYLLNNFTLELNGYDAIIGYRADDSYFSFAEDFLNNAISINKLKHAMYLGELGEQFVLKSPLAFSKIKFIGTEPALRKDYLVPKKFRDLKARREYLDSNRSYRYSRNDLYMLDILRQEVKPDDSRLF